MECFRLLFDHLAWIEHQFLRGIRDSRKSGSLWWMMRGVGGVRKSIPQSWLAKGLGLLCCLKGVQEEIPWEEASTLRIGSAAFPPAYSLSSEAVVMRQLRRWKKALTKVIDTLTSEDFHGAFQKLLERYNKCIAAGGDYFEGD